MNAELVQEAAEALRCNQMAAKDGGFQVNVPERLASISAAMVLSDKRAGMETEMYEEGEPLSDEELRSLAEGYPYGHPG
jgi:hypothetical protein